MSCNFFKKLYLSSALIAIQSVVFATNPLEKIDTPDYAVISQLPKPIKTVGCSEIYNPSWLNTYCVIALDMNGPDREALLYHTMHRTGRELEKALTLLRQMQEERRAKLDPQSPYKRLLSFVPLGLARITLSLNMLASPLAKEEIRPQTESLTYTETYGNVQNLEITGCCFRINEHLQLPNFIVLLKNLTYLDMGSNRISNISPLTCLPRIETLILDYNQISDISPLRNFRVFKYLSLENNKITDVTPLKGVEKIEILNLSGNPIHDLSPLKDIILDTLIIYGTPALLPSKDSADPETEAVKKLATVQALFPARVKIGNKFMGHVFGTKP